ncbi:hypothetical protein RUM44_011382 [Polyplax serrata]|uniref:Solute carrier family 35 member F5 n=1 Tax=Polyplax serrata TaxID=468196 RepID=A0ABR1ARM6_POLSC
MFGEPGVRTELSFEGMLTKTQRLILGIVVLLLVDIIWVSSSEITQYIYENEKFDKPFFTSYFKTSLFSLYLLGLCFWPPWRDQCSNPPAYMYLDPSNEEENYYIQENTSLSDPQFVPIKSSDRSSSTESDDSSIHAVRFSKMAEVRHMSDANATEALLARLSYQASVRAGEVARKSANKFPINVVAKIAFMFCFLWFIANYTYQASLNETETGIVTVLSSTSSLFTLLLAAIFPANSGDKFTLSKLAAVLLNLSGLVLVCVSDFSTEKKIPTGALLALVSALFYAAYLVFLRRRVESENKIDIPMFFGFVGLFNLILLWPFFFLLHYNNWEPFEWPTQHQWMFLLLNGLIGTVLSEVLWLWGCFLTSSLIATVAISLTIPMAIFVDMFFKRVNYPYIFYFGTVPMFLAFFVVVLLLHMENWDPILDITRKCCGFISPYFRASRSEYDVEQTEALIGITMDNEDI